MGPTVAAVLALLATATVPPAPEPYLTPAFGLGVRAAATGLDEALAGPGGRVYRAQPEILFGFRAGEQVDVVAGGAVGPAYLVRVRGPRSDTRSVDLTASGALGLRFPAGGTTVLATARAEAITGGVVAVTFDLRMSFGGGS
jgi:hypothetical protein